MKNKHRKIILLRVAACLIGFASLILLASSALAAPEQERIYLLQLLHQIDAMQSTVLATEKAQDKTARVQFHYTGYQDASGQHHNGVWEDLQQIRSGIQAQLNSTEVEPRSLPPLDEDELPAGVMP